MNFGRTSADEVDVATAMRRELAVLAPLRREVIDDSARHAGHAGVRGGGGHYRLLIVSAAFLGKSRLARHRLVHAALDELLRSRIHALSIQALTPAEVSSVSSIAS